MDTQVLISISIYFIFMLAIGVYAYKKSTNSLSEYMLGDRGLGPAVTALSAGAADMSGWMLMGLPGAMYATGISSVWIAIGLTVGAYLNYLLLAPRLRVFTEVADNSITIPNYFEKRFQDTSRILRIASAIVIIIFFTLYCSAGLVSGGTLFESAFGIDYKIGLFVTAGVVIAYTLFGGFLAVSLTDFVQGLIMFIALIMVPLVAFTNIGGVKPVFDEIQHIDPKLLNIFTGTSVVGIVSLLAWGLGYFGQPHIIVRFMAISTVKELKPARRIGMSWMLFTIVGAALTGLVGIAYISVNNLTLKDPETIFIFFANTLFHPLITGFLLSAILAAIMSTISSQLLVTSSALTEDLYRIFGKKDITEKELVRVGRLSVLIVAIVSLLLSLQPNDTILNLVGNAWAGFGAAFGPAILLSLFWKRMTRWGALAGMVVGALTVIIWISVDVIKQTINLYEMVPGFFFSLVAVIVVSLITTNNNRKIEEQYEEMEKRLA